MKRTVQDLTEKLLTSDTRALLLLLFLALIIRLIALDRIYLISRDGVHFVSLANLLWSGHFLEALSHPFHPLYPALMALASSVTGDKELSGKVVSLASSTLTVIPLFLLGKAMYTARIGFVGALFFVFQPYAVRFSVDVLSDSLFLFLFVLSFSLGLRAATGRERKNFLSMGAGLCGGLAYLARPEGIAVIIFILGCFLYGQIGWGRKKVKEFLLMVALLLLSFSVVASPYPIFIKYHTGRWQISMKPSITKSLQVGAIDAGQESSSAVNAPPYPTDETPSSFIAPAKPREAFHTPGLWKCLIYPPLKFIETYHYLLFLFLLFGMWATYKGKVRRQGVFLLVFMVVYLCGLCYLYYTVSYVSRRHFLPPIVLTLPLAAVGFCFLEHRFSEVLEGSSFRWARTMANHATTALILVVALTLLPKALKSQGLDKLSLKQAALWIKKKGGKICPTIMSNEPLVAYYAGGKHIPVPGTRYIEFVQYVEAHHVNYLVFERRDIESGEKFLSQLRPERFRKVTLREDGVLVYRVSP